jgi:pimeloyl-ACP methyl ester carboxylesterase
MTRSVTPPLRPGWVIVDDEPLFHRTGGPETSALGPIVHVHGFGISGTYLEPTTALLAERHPTFVPDLPGSGRSPRPSVPLDIPGMARVLIGYLDANDLSRVTLVGNSLGCVVLVELAAAYPERIDRLVLVSPAGGPNNQPMARALRQMAFDGPREPFSLYPIAVADYVRFGIPRSWALFRAMTAYPTLERLQSLRAPTLVIGGSRDPLVDFARATVFAGLPHVDVVRVPGAHALNFSRPALIAELIEAHLEGRDLATLGSGVQVVAVQPPAATVPRASSDAKD